MTIEEMDFKVGDLVFRATGWDIKGNPIIFSQDLWEIEQLDNDSVVIHDYPDFRSTMTTSLKDLKK